jgi:hypothetical protein
VAALPCRRRLAFAVGSDSVRRGQTLELAASSPRESMVADTIANGTTVLLFLISQLARLPEAV